MSEKDNEYNKDDSMVDKILKTVNADGSSEHQHDERNEEYTIDNKQENAPDEGREDVPTKDKIVRDPVTGEETFIKNDNKSWKLK